MVAQYAGRLHRENEGKTDVRIYDYIDIHEPVCESMYRKRLKGYSAIGYRVLTKEVSTLFDATEDLHLSSCEGQIFNGNTFRYPIVQELKSSNQSVVISSPRLYRVERNALIKTCLNFRQMVLMLLFYNNRERTNRVSKESRVIHKDCSKTIVMRLYH